MEKAKTLRAFASSREPQKEEAKPARVPKLRFPEFRDLPSWSETTVGRISDTVIAGGTPSTSEKKFWGGDIRWMNSGELNDKKVSEVQGRITLEGLNNSSTKLIPPRCVLIGLAGQGKTRGTVALNLVELCTNQSIAAIFPNDSAFNSDFLYHDLDKRYNELRRLSAGGEGRGGLNLQIIKSLKVALPSPAEQQKIAECLSSVDELMAAQARKVDALKTHKKGLMQQLFPREGETQPRLRFSNREDWAIVALPEVAFFQEGPGIMAVDFHSEGVPLVRLAGVSGPVVTLDGCNFLDPAKVAQKWAHFRLESNDLLISTSATFGLSSLVTEAAAGAVFYTGLIRFRPSSDRLDRGYLKTYLGSPHFERQVETAAVGGGIKHFGPSHLKQMEIPILPLEEQQRIATCLSSLDARIAAEAEKLEALKTHKRGLMQQLFPSPEEVAG
ncbi:MAG: restriction endonuclease subunit S [Verrucomicrobiales bacterium]|nr:restriction endonuclease subunit S [Verrucomicrobiales bacterium]